MIESAAEIPHNRACEIIESSASDLAGQYPEPITLCKGCMPKTISWARPDETPVSWAEFITSRRPEFASELGVDLTSLPDHIPGVTELSLVQMRRIVVEGLPQSDEPMVVCNFIEGPHITSANDLRARYSQLNSAGIYEGMVTLRFIQFKIERGQLRGFHSETFGDPFAQEIPTRTLEIRPA